MMKPANEFGHMLGYGWRGRSQPYLADPTYRRASLDNLKYTQEQLLSTLERSEITDKLGELALELHETAQLLEPVEAIGENDVGVDTSKALDWWDKDVIPLLGDVNFTAPAAVAPMPAQRKIITETLLRRGYSKAEIYTVEISLDRLCRDLLTTRVDSTSNRTGVCSYAIFPSGEEFLLYGRPYVGMLSSGIRIFDVATLSHETTHALDFKQTAITDFMTEEDRLRDKLREELRAYAVGYYVEDCLSNSYNIGRCTKSISHEVERIRREVNGPVDSEDAFAVHDDLVHRIGRAGLDCIYKKVV
jgi:hypothetical protein